MVDTIEIPAPSPQWHALPVDAAVIAAGADTTAGLASDEAARRAVRYGLNALPEPRREPLFLLLLRQFKSPLIYLLLAAGGTALALGESSDALVIFVVVLTNAVIGALQEGRASRSIAALRRLTGHSALVWRGGRDMVIHAAQVVPGDLLILAAGDAVVADARLVEAAALYAAEAPLTGESLPVPKSTAALPEDTPPAERRNMVFAGTNLTAGRARAVVIATGLSTEIGRISQLTAGSSEPPTPLEKRIDHFGRQVMIVAGGLFLLVLGLGWLRGVEFAPLLMIALSQVVGLIPEGLPVAMTIALSVGVQRMARRRAIVRRLSAVETLGSTTVICTDKTGTLTRNEMTVMAVVLPGRPEIEVSGGGYDPSGTLTAGGRTLEPASDAELRRLLEAGLLCNDARLVSPDKPDGAWSLVGDPTEGALVTLAVKAGLDVDALRAAAPRQAEIPFDADARLMATQHPGAGAGRVILKGAPEAVLQLCAGELRAGQVTPLDDAARAAARTIAEGLASRALRVLALAEVPDADINGQLGLEAFAGRATLLGWVGEMDPPRPEARAAVAACLAAGIRPVMITGDHEATGLAVARLLGIAGVDGGVMSGRDLDALSDPELDERLKSTPVFARVHPAQKLRLVRAFQRTGEIVAMTGDGVNDAPALLRADVGVAMGHSGTEVAREAARIVITDDNFASIVAAIEEGRVAFQNIKKVLLLLFSTSVAEVAILIGALALGYPPPFAAVQILWNNLVTEGVIVVNLIMDPPDGDEMRRRPTPPNEPLVTRAMLRRMGVMTPAIVISSLGWFIWRLGAGVPFPQVQSESFTLLAVCEWFNVLNCRSETRSAFNFGALRNPWLVGGLVVGNLLQAAVIFLPSMNRLFHTVPFGLDEVLAIGAVASLVLWVEEARKLFRRRALRRASRAQVGPNLSPGG